MAIAEYMIRNISQFQNNIESYAKIQSIIRSQKKEISQL